MGRVRKKHPREFKIEVVRKLQSGEVSLAELSRRLSVSASELCEPYGAGPRVRELAIVLSEVAFDAFAQAGFRAAK